MITILICFLLIFFGLFTIVAPGMASVVMLFLSTIETIHFTLFGIENEIAVWFQLFFLGGSGVWWWITKEQINWEIGCPVIGIIVAVLLSIPFSIQPVEAFFAVIPILSYVITFYFAAYFIKTSSSKINIYTAIYGLLGYFSILSLLQMFIASEWDVLYLHAWLSSGELFAVVLIGIVPFLLAGLYESKGAGQFVINIALLPVILFMVIGTQTISGLLLLVVAICIMYINGFISRKIVTGFIGALFVALILMIYAEVMNLITLHDWFDRAVNSTRVQVRAQNMVLAFMTFAENPIVGVGAGQWGAYSAWAFPNVSFPIRVNDSSLLNILSENGLFGVLAFGYFIQSLFPCGKLLCNKTEKTRIQKAICVSLWIWIAASIFYSVHLHLLTWVWLGMLAGIGQWKNQERVLTQPKTAGNHR